MAEKVQINFSRNGEGAILMTAVGNTLYLDKNLSNDMKVGDLVSMNYENFERLAELNFYKTESIDILIEKLIAIKNYILLASAG